MNGSWVGAGNEIGAQIVDAVLRASWQGAIAIGLVWLICRTWKHIPSSVRCAMWFLVSLKLIVALVPAGIAIPCLPSSSHHDAPVTRMEYPQSAKAPSTSLSLPATMSEAIAAPLAKESLSTTTWLAGIWILGVGFVGAYSIWQLAKLLRQIRKASPCTDRSLLDQAEEVRQVLGVRPKPTLKMTNDPTSVLTFGSLRPIVLISAKTIEECTPEERRMVLAHEFAHIRRRDAWLGLIPQFAQTLFYFHPMVWLACREFSFAREAACDEEAISCLQIGSDLYGRLLLKLGSRRKTATALYTPGVSSHFHLLRRRIAMLDKPTETTLRRTHRRPLAITCLIGALCIIPLTLVQGQYASTASLKNTPSYSAKFAAKRATKKSATLTKTTAKHALIVVAKKNLGGSSPSLHVFRLKNADAEKAATVLRQVLVAESGGKVAADAKSNSIVVNADEATTAQIANVIKNLDDISRVEPMAPTVPKEPQQVTFFPVKYTEVGRIIDLLHTLYGDPAIAVVKIAADLRTNSIVVTAPENRTREVSELITKLDVPIESVPAGKRTVTRYIKVRNGDPKEIVARVVAMMKKDAPEYMAPDPTNDNILVITTEDNCNRVQMLVNILDYPKHPTEGN